MAREYKPPEILPIPDDETLDFLAGPVQGAPDWQRQAVEYITAMSDHPDTVHVANPRRDYIGDSFDYDAQVAWEKHHLKRAARSPLGGIAVWFAAQDYSLPYETGRRYAKTTQKELDRIFGWLDYDPNIHLSVGIEPGCEIDTRHYLDTCLAEFSLPTFDNLEAVCNYLVTRSV